MKKFTSVIVPAHNEETYISRCLDSLLCQDYGRDNYELIVVDNDSDDGTKNIVKAYENVKYYYKKEGPVGAVRNFGASCASGPYFAFIDADCVAPKNWLSKGAELLDKSKYQAFGGRYIPEENSLWIEKYWLLGIKKELYDATDFLGGCIFIKKSHFYKVQGFAENISSGEDTKLALDLKIINIRTTIDQAINVVHLGNAKDIKSFIKRQSWHSENYIKNIRSSIIDPTFWITITFMVSIAASAGVLIAKGSTQLLFIPCIVAVSCPALFSAKRIFRSKKRSLTIAELIKIYFIDILYITGRCFGIIKGIIK